MKQYPVLIMKQDYYSVKIYHYETTKSKQSFKTEEMKCESYEEAIALYDLTLKD